jgi:hypothetical protein
LPPPRVYLPPQASRWSASGWAFLRQGDGQELGTGGTLGGSQIGGRIGYRINGNAALPLSIFARLYAPIKRRAGSEAALGLEWKPVARLPLRVLAERRQAVGSEGRSAFALMSYGGLGDVRLLGGVRLEAYAQAGVVGVRSRDLFADGSVALALPMDEERKLTVGGALWAAAQPGSSRVDAGPRLSLKLPGAERVRVIADWRFRVRGKASPASGPSLTVATDF